jgi:glycosyltransferase involved in cell wall biosynthesis
MKTKNKSYRLAYLGTLETKDDPFVMIDVIRTIIKEGFSVSLDIVGASENMGNGKIISSICETDPVLKGIVHFHGRISDDELYSYLQMADALLLIKMGDPISQAAFPTRLPELLLTGRPVITTNVGDVSEYLHDNVHVIIPPAGDVRAIADRVITLIKERGLGEEIGIQGRKRAIEVFSYQAYVYQFLNFISQFRDLSS